MDDPTTSTRRSWGGRILSLAVSLPLATGGLLVAGQVAAFAHTTAIQGHAVCDTAAGAYTVTWVGATDQVPLGDLATVTTTSHWPAASLVPGTVTTTLAPNASYTFVQSGIPGTATTASVAVHVVWGPNPVNPNNLPTSDFAADATGSVTGLTGCDKALTQTLSGHIYDCAGNGTPTAVEHPGTLSATGPTAVATQASPLLPKNVTAGAYQVTANAPAGYQFVACGATPASGSTTTTSVSVPAGGTASAIFYVAPIVHSQTIAGNIYDCTNGATTNVVTGGTLAVAGTALTAGSALSPTGVPASTYTMNATAPAGYQLVACGVTTGTPSSKSVVVPQDGAGLGTFYVAPIPVVVHSQTIEGYIYDCTTGATRTIVPGGTLAVAGTALTGGSSLNPSNVPANTYTMNATAPTGYQLVACGVTTGTPASRTVVVQPDGAGVGTFYVAPIPVQTIAGHIYDCSVAGPTTTEQPHGTLAATGKTPVAQQTNPLAATKVDADSYTMTATAPAGYRFVTCGSAAAQIVAGAATATEPVLVPVGGDGVGVFYVEPITQTLEGHIYDCSNGAPGTAEHAGGSISATGPVTIASGDNPLAATPVPAGDYDVVAVAPTGFHLVTCPAAGPASSHQAVTVPAGGAENATFYVAPNAVTGGTTSGGAQGPTVRPVVVPPAPVVTVRPPTTGTTTAPAVTGLPFTGSNSGVIVRLGALLVTSGVALLVLGGVRRREI